MQFKLKNTGLLLLQYVMLPDHGAVMSVSAADNVNDRLLEVEIHFMVKK